MKEELISIIIPVYNTEKYIEKCISSVLNQTYHNLEIILVDDGSTDRSGHIIDEIAKKDERIVVIHQPNSGSSSARNTGLDAAHGRYIGFVDSDDDIENDMYGRLHETALQYPNHIIQCGREELGENGEVLPPVCTTPGEMVICQSEEFLRELLLHREDCSMCTKLFQASLFSDRRFPVGELNEDFRVLIKLLLETEGIAKIPFSGYHVCYRMGSNTRKTDENDFSSCFYDNITSADYVQALVAERFPALAKVALRFGIFQRLDYMLHIPVRDMIKSNEQYRSVLKYLRRHFFAMLVSRYLTVKNKLYLVLLTLAPVVTRKIHRAKMKKRQMG